MIELKIEFLPAINYSLVNNRIGICQSIEIRNKSNIGLRDVIIECGGEFFNTTRSAATDVIKARSSVRLQGIDLQPSPEKVASITEKTLTTFNIKVIAKENNGEAAEVHSQDYQIEVMPYNQWLGTSILPQCLASFVIPNHPAINNVIVKAAQILKELSNSSQFTEYQTGNTTEVRKQVAAVYGALHAESIVYRSMPASYEDVGQRITLPHQVLASKLGNCIELTLLFASVLESIGINSGVIIQQGHAYLTVWLVDDCCQYSVCDDPSYVEKKCSEGIDEMLVLECTRITSENTSFEEAQRLAEKNLADLSMFEMFIDIRRCRLERILPLPFKIQDNGAWEIDTAGVEHDECVLNVKEHSRYDLSKVMESKRELTKMDLWERKLLDFSLRNSMLNLYLRQKAIQFISFDVNLIEDHLQDGEEYVISPKPNIDLRIPDDERLVRSKMMPELHELISNDIKHHILHSYMTEQETRNTLKNIYRASRNAIEETGANALYLAIGTLRWFETELSEKPRYAPILMLPVDILYKKGEHYIRTRDEDISLNITLIEFLRQNYDISIPGLNPLPRDEHGVDVTMIFAIIREALKNKKRWDVEEEAILGVFSFSKFLMWNDIHNHRQELLDSEIVRSLAEQKLAFTPTPVISDLKEADKSQKPDSLSLPVSVDSSQMAAVIEGGKGHSFILYGPPGTGKSQTITNLIANALYQGKRVLFVAEKMAALSVVQNRLEKIGLAPFCLEMHSNKITKRHVLEQMKLALGVTHIVKPEEYARVAEQLYEQRTKLIEYMEALHDTKGGDGMSLYDCIVRYESIDAPELDIDTNDRELREKFNIREIDTYNHLLIDKFNAIVNLVGQPSKHPLNGLMIDESDLADISQLSVRMKDAAERIQAGINDWNKLSDASSLRSEIMRDCNEGIFNENANALYQEWREVKAKWFIPRFFAKRKYISKIREYNKLIIEQDIDGFLTKLMDYQKLHLEIKSINETINRYFDINTTDDVLPSTDVLGKLVAKLTEWTRHTDKARDWYQWCAYKKELSEVGFNVIAKKIESCEIMPGTLCDSFFKSMFKSLANEKISQSSLLRTFEGTIFDETVSRYQKLTDDFQMLSQKELYARLASQIPHLTDNIDNSSEIGLLNRNISNGGRGLSLRDLMDQIPTLLPRLCPCMLMSPMSVAQFLDLSQDKFDLVVFDEASQMPTSEAVGAIARGKAVIVVGDPKQMPPTSFFSSTSVSEDEADLDDMESILEDCRTLEIPSLQLNWHYRSKHESLIAFSNNEYYDGTLITFPSVDDQTTKVKYHYVDGVYDKGGRRSNKKEAEAIVKEIARRLEMPDHADLSIGVIAFSVVQQNLIEDMLIDLLEKNKKLREAADEMYEPIFVKNLENVQGDERDIIMFSIGYGPDKDGKVSMNFGPLNNVGGERRLNVAVSRARREMLVFSALKASQIDLRRSKAKGVEGLKHFLEYAEQQVLVQATSTNTKTSDSVIAEQIANALRKKGYAANTNIGRSNFKVDVAISEDADSENYSLGLLLDGEGYHQTQTTRDREIVQPSVLRMLNWNIMRIWSVDWLNNPERVISRIEQCMKEKPARVAPEKKTVFDISNETIEEIKSEEEDYREYVAKSNVAKMSDEKLALDILRCEQPMTLTYLCKKVCTLRIMPRITPAMLSSVTEIANRTMFVENMGGTKVVWTDEESRNAFKGYRKNNGRDVTEIPLIEVMNAITESVTEQFSINTDALTLIVAKKLGFTRRGTKVDKALSDALAILIAEGKIVNADGMLRLPNA
ncbi:MAG: DUF4011 domain-containing protein [Prevotella sp.]|nr:DUF4011 domain-containing protein [Prevotella sp.]